VAPVLLEFSGIMATAQKTRLTELQIEIALVQQLIQARRIREQLSEPQPVSQWRANAPTTPIHNGKRDDRLAALAALPNAPRVKLTSLGRYSEEGHLRREIARNEAEIKRLQWVIYIGERNAKTIAKMKGDTNG